MRDFSNKVAAITGAGSGIGRALAQNLAAKGCHLALSDVNSEGLAETARLCEASGVKVTTAALDVADRAAVFAWAGQVVQEHGRVNLIFNNAGVALSVPVETARIEDFEWLMNINFWGVVHGTQAFLPHLRASEDGHVINISSLFGLIAVPTQGTYNASKFAVRGYTEALRMELEMAEAPVSVTCVHPGGVATRIADSGRVDASVTDVTGESAEEARANARKAIQTTTPASAAEQILRGVERNARRVLVGPDARWLDRLVRLLGSSAYQPVLLWILRKRKSNV
ncbi:SDR family NAD(P)-dependent oxidoreductase [Halopseudomonas salegens]|uniref:NADP-dependent 3-hydroxy acid dehydrogenase YdfG n=1 Tax=Halopseudomonas salegens TaxID=1434072 RepID=A0A1H2I0Z9_9GAMM|nr:SDR family NAD(P)-dependent oxidoreductase [Halopseudomonas salegens]SDU37759.1 NADP-dependent 3-hydroxy acid dehydrogenase YdfG [Halopseudomonas salegens]